MIFILQQHREFTAVVCNKLEQSVFSFQKTRYCMTLRFDRGKLNGKLVGDIVIPTKVHVWCNLIRDSN